METELTKGWPQGSCCGPIFWNLQYNSFLDQSFTNHTKVIAFADDLILLTEGKNKEEIENYANMEMQKIAAWSRNNKVSFNEDKSKVMMISRKKRQEDKELCIFLNNKQLEQVNELKYLGIIIDSRFNFNAHIDHSATRCTKLIHSLSKSAKISWGLRHEALKTIYKGAILPLLLYGAPVWIEAMAKQYNQIKYKRVQRLINIKVAKAFRTTSNEALCMVTGLTPIIIKIEEIAGLNAVMKRRETEGLQLDLPRPIETWPHPADFDVIKNVRNNMEYTLEVYTDGSKNEKGVGSGVAIFTNHILTHKLKFRLHNRCSNNQVEQLAIVKALEKIKELSTSEIELKTVAVYTDSQVTLDSLRNSSIHNDLIETIRNKLRTLEEDNWIIEFSWIKAHAGHRGNELADQLAKQAAGDNELEFCYTRIPKSQIIREMQEMSVNKWETEWQMTTKGEVTKSFLLSSQFRSEGSIVTTKNFDFDFFMDFNFITPTF